MIKDLIEDVKKEKPAYIIVIAFAIAVIGVGVYFTIANALAGYAYKSEVTMNNNTGENILTRFIISGVNMKALVDGGYIQDDAEDVSFSIGNVEQPITVTGLEANNGYFILPYLDMIPYSQAKGYIWTGSHNASRNQMWIAHGSDTVYCGDNASLDIESLLMLVAKVEALEYPATPCQRQIILAKPSSYGLYLAGTPNNSWQFEICNAATCTQINLPATLNQSGTLTAWYNGGSMIMNHTIDGQTGVSKSGSITVYTNDLYACQFKGYCDNCQVRTELP